MVTITAQRLEGERIRYRGDSWEFTGTVDVLQNGEVLDVEARKADRVRGTKGTLSFRLENPPTSINPGNLGDVDIELRNDDGGQFLVVSRNHRTDRYKLKNLIYK